MDGQRVGFIGLGAMGSVMARRLAEAGHLLTVWARRPEVAAPLAARGATVAGTPAALAAAVDTVILCVTDTDAVASVVFGADGVAAGARAGTLLVDHSTIHPVATRDFATRLATDHAMGWVDAPVSGGVPGAEAGRLVVMAGGEQADLARVEPLLAAYAARITLMGAAGCGQASKVVNQMLIGAAVAAVAEGLNFAANFGVDAASLPDALAGGWADSAVLQNHARRMAAAAYAGDVDARIMAKDMDIALDMGRQTGSPMPVAALVQQMYRELIANGDADKGQIGLMWRYARRAL
ncbi:MAG: NAD(P)-dependent oxidoreductase [Gammaproteobacteria bacterium]|nr:NAD(P)-dependent oxidoreductase [Gammaproteobacteria bacterium]MCP5199840.1 NAD(P)-dependent oxidoreductase [Gammaproteobacteria bacterium]